MSVGREAGRWEAAVVEDDFAGFYRREYVAMARLAGLLTGSNLDNEDLAQDAFAAVRDRYGSLQDPTAYLRRAVINRAKRWHRDNQRHDRRLQVLGGGSADVPAPDGELADVVADLPYRQRVVIVGRYWAGWTEVEIAAALGCRPGTVKSLASRALATLRIQLDPREEESF